MKWVAVCLGLGVFLCPTVWADVAPEQVSLWHQFYFDKGLDYTKFGDLGSTRTQFRREFVEEIATLQELGAKPIEAAAVLLALDAHYLETIDRAAQGIEASFAAEFRAALVAEYERAYKPQRLIIVDGTAFGARDASAGQASADIDVVATGTWSNVDGSTVRVTVDFIAVATGRLTSFTAQGTVPATAGDIAFQVFDYFEHERAPQPIDALGNVEVRPALPGHQGRAGVPRDVAARACEGQGCRLPYSYELDAVYAMGPYHRGGAYIDPNWYYHVADDAEHVWTAPGKLEHVDATSRANFEKREPYYLMVKGTPSPKVQALASLDSYLRAEYRKPALSRDTVGAYAARLVRADLDSKYRENPVAVRAMSRALDERGVTAWEYLDRTGLPRELGFTPAMRAAVQRADVR